jgi:hypothetical protein
MTYRNPEVIYRFTNEWDVPAAEARRIFDDMKRFLWLVTQPGNQSIAPVPIVDEMWHTFLAFTVDYARWGRDTFGRMLHHVPTTSHEKQQLRRRFRRSPARARAELQQRLVADIGKVYDGLGEAVVLRWYVEYPETYDRRWFRTRRRPPELPAVRIPAALRRLAGRGRSSRGRRAIKAA